MSPGLLAPTCTPARQSLAYVARAPLAKIQSIQGGSGAGPPPGTRRTAATSTTTSTSRSTSRWRPSSTTTARPRSTAQAGTSYYVEGDQPLELPGQSHFLRDGDRVFHTYSTFGRGGEMTGGSYYFLDLTALGRQEDWEEPKGRAADRARRDAGLRDLASGERAAPGRTRSRRPAAPATTRRASLRRWRARARRRSAIASAPMQLLDDGLLQPQAALAAHGEQLLRAAQVEDLGAVGGSQALDQERVAPGQRGRRRTAGRAAARKPSSWTSTAPSASTMPGRSKRLRRIRRAAARRGCQAWIPHPQPAAGARWSSPHVASIQPSPTRPRRAALRRGKPLAAVLDHHPPGAQAVERPGDQRRTAHDQKYALDARRGAPQSRECRLVEPEAQELDTRGGGGLGAATRERR